MDAAGEVAQLADRALEVAGRVVQQLLRLPGRLVDPPARACRESESATSRCCAPSCRSRSIRLPAASALSTIRAREARSSLTLACSSAARRSFSSASAAAPTTACTSSRSSVTEGSWSSIATGSPPRCTGVQERAAPGSRQRHGPAGRVDPRRAFRQPIGERQRRVAERARERVAQRAVAAPVAEPRHQVADRRRSRHPAAQQPGEEGERDRRERDHARPLERLLRPRGDVEDAEHRPHRVQPQHQAAARVHERPRAALRPSRAAPAAEHHDAEHDDQDRHDRQPPARERVEQLRPVGDQQRVGGQAGSRRLVDGQADPPPHGREQVGRADQRDLPRLLEPSRREGEEDVEQDRVRHRDADQPGDERPRVGGDDQPGQAVAEPDRDQQRAEAVLGTALPGEQPGPDRGAADDRTEHGDQVAVMPADAVDRDGQRDHTCHDAEGGEPSQQAPQSWRGNRHGAHHRSGRDPHGPWGYGRMSLNDTRKRPSAVSAISPSTCRRAGPSSVQRSRKYAQPSSPGSSERLMASMP